MLHCRGRSAVIGANNRDNADSFAKAEAACPIKRHSTPAGANWLPLTRVSAQTGTQVGHRHHEFLRQSHLPAAHHSFHRGTAIPVRNGQGLGYGPRNFGKIALELERSCRFTRCALNSRSSRQRVRPKCIDCAGRPFLCDAVRPLLAQSRHRHHAERCPLLGVKRTWLCRSVMSAFDPKRTPLSKGRGCRTLMR